MSTRHLEEIERMVAGIPATIPVREILMLPDYLRFCDGYDPCAFGTPGGAPRLLGRTYPVVWQGNEVFIYIDIIDTATYAKLEMPS